MVPLKVCCYICKNVLQLRKPYIIKIFRYIMEILKLLLIRNLPRMESKITLNYFGFFKNVVLYLLRMNILKLLFIRSLARMVLKMFLNRYSGFKKCMYTRAINIRLITRE